MAYQLSFVKEIYDGQLRYKLKNVKEVPDGSAPATPDDVVITDTNVYDFIYNNFLENKIYVNDLTQISDTSTYLLVPRTVNEINSIVLNAYKKTRLSGLQYDFDDLVILSEYIYITIELASKGYFITDTNREEKYIEILNSGDANLLDLLEKYLSIYDEFKVTRNKFIKYVEFKVQLTIINGDIAQIVNLYQADATDPTQIDLKKDVIIIGEL
jgi:hypothetical protein